MTPQDLLRGLRDIHLPPDPAGFAQSGVALWPFAALAVVLAAWLALVLWRRGAWRRRARAQLAALERQADWAALVALAIKVARRSRPQVEVPEAVYRDPRSLGPDEHDRLRQRIAEALR